MKDRYVIQTIAKPRLPLSRHRTLEQAAAWITERDQYGSVEVMAVDRDRPDRTQPLSPADRATLDGLLDAAYGETPPDGTPRRAIRQIAEASGPMHVLRLDETTRQARRR